MRVSGFRVEGFRFRVCVLYILCSGLNRIFCQRVVLQECHDALVRAAVETMGPSMGL